MVFFNDGVKFKYYYPLKFLPAFTLTGDTDLYQTLDQLYRLNIILLCHIELLYILYCLNHSMTPTSCLHWNLTVSVENGVQSGDYQRHCRRQSRSEWQTYSCYEGPLLA